MSKCVYKLTVRGYELDSFGHVNNAVYLQYAEAALWNFFKINGLLEYTLDRNIFPVLMECSQRYMHELKLLDEVRIESEFTSDGDMIICKHKIINNTTDVLSCKIKGKIVFVNHERVIHSIPDEVREILGRETDEDHKK
ncbi:acyl-CoA thioesterase [Ruminococcus albus]|uniref:Acyl-CoA thioester hydrolase n=1 Tax=Ruminococcus albus TaxID=1264 RepID=A0A1I1Q1N7_RUMAL|nr:thioesterase family protein [Ruminococcus albus]SFD15969.1 acyl-CoA thioester hydrolase [Ruminococcus albus]